MHNNQSMHYPSYSRWSWIVALILAIILLWMLVTGHGPNTSCCVKPSEPVAASEVTALVEPSTVAQVFGFTATANDFTSDGSSANISWLSKSDALKTLLAGGEGLQAQGDDKEVVLRGSVSSEETKQKIGSDALALFGPSVTVDNQILVKSAEPVAATVAPPASKLYFDTAVVAQPADSAATLAPIITWLNANPTAKAIISGYHDARGGKARNEQLAKDRAKSTYDALVAAGVDAARIEMRKPQSVDGGSNLNEARRVEVSVE
jgi:outer membrane protein OmpA-like peptidoglycan-associated protein